MKITVNNQSDNYRVGDFFKTDTGTIRRIVQGIGGVYIQNFERGASATSTHYESAEQAVKEYIRANGEIKKISVKEVILNCGGN